MDFNDKNDLWLPVLIRDYDCLYCQKGAIMELLDENYAHVMVDGLEFPFHRDDLMSHTEQRERLFPSEYSFKSIMTALKCGTLKPLS